MTPIIAFTAEAQAIVDMLRRELDAALYVDSSCLYVVAAPERLRAAYGSVVRMATRIFTAFGIRNVRQILAAYPEEVPEGTI